MKGCGLWAFMRTKFLCVSVLRVASRPRVKLASCKSALNPLVVCPTDRSKAVVPVLVLVFVALWFILRGDLLYVVPCVILFLCFFSVLLVLRLPRLGKTELIFVLCVRLFGLCLFGFVGFFFLLGLWGGGGGAAVCNCGTPWTFLLPFLPCVILFLCFTVLLALRLPSLRKRELILVHSYVYSNCACLDLSFSSTCWCL